MQNLNQFEIVEQNELEQVQGGVGLSIVIGGSLLAAGVTGVAGYWLSRTFGYIMTDADLSVTEGGIVVTTSTAVAWGVLGVVTYMYGRHLGSRR